VTGASDHVLGHARDALMAVPPDGDELVPIVAAVVRDLAAIIGPSGAWTKAELAKLAADLEGDTR
jgi:hypothetical protein